LILLRDHFYIGSVGPRLAVLALLLV
jgi:hypothetical protein